MDSVTDFIKKNQIFWSEFTSPSEGKKILIEEPYAPFITHVNAIFSLILNQAKHYTPVWLHSSRLDLELIKSYVSTSQSKNLEEPSLLEGVILFTKAISFFIRIYKTKDILSFAYDKVKYGDIVYDTYLMEEKVGTIKHIDLEILHIIYRCILRHETIKNLLKSDNYDGVLVSHQIDINSGVMLRVALRYGYKGFLRAGHHQSTLQCFERLDEVYDYEYKPFPHDVNNIIKKIGSKLDSAFKIVFEKQVSGRGDADGKYAYSPKNKFYSSKKAFCKNYNLNPQKRNVFIMLHALNDYPHVHFRWMVFKDFYEWFMDTLNFVKNINNVNWIFKQHPSIKFYPTRDISFDKIFRNTPSNVVYIDENNQIDTRSLIYCTDVIITCLGSSGFELPAIARIPTIVASDTFYSGLGFTHDPQTRKEYFKLLENIETMSRLTEKQQNLAKAAYIYIYEFSRVSMSSCPMLSLKDQNDIRVYNSYWQKVGEFYKIHATQIKKEILNYIKEVSRLDFKRLDSLAEFMENNLST